MPATYLFRDALDREHLVVAGSYLEASELAGRVGAVRFVGGRRPVRAPMKSSPLSKAMLGLVLLTIPFDFICGWQNHSFEAGTLPTLTLAGAMIALLAAGRVVHEGGHVAAVKLAPRTPFGRRRRVNGIGLWILTGMHVVVWGRPDGLRFYRRDLAYVVATLPAFDPKALLLIARGGPFTQIAVGIAALFYALIWGVFYGSPVDLFMGWPRTIANSCFYGVLSLDVAFWPSMAAIGGLLGIAEGASNLRSKIVTDRGQPVRSDGYHIETAKKRLRQLAVSEGEN